MPVHSLLLATTPSPNTSYAKITTPNLTFVTPPHHHTTTPTIAHCWQVYLEDAGFDWKVLGPDVQELEYVAWVADQDAYACSGQKCSAQSILFMHDNWVKAGTHQLWRSLCARCCCTLLLHAVVCIGARCSFMSMHLQVRIIHVGAYSLY